MPRFGWSIIALGFLPCLVSAEEIALPADSILLEETTFEESGFFPWAQRWSKHWSGEIGAGINGSAGNTERFNTRLGLDAKRSGEKADFITSLLYAKGSADGEETENKFISKFRNEWKLSESPWSLYAFNTNTYDEFQNWDLRLVLGTGVGYQFLDTETTTLQARLGAGTSREFGGNDDRFIPEGNFGADFKHKLTERQSITAGMEYFPSFEEFGDYRVDTQAAWECVIDPEHNLTLKIGVLDRYQSRPDGAKRNDVDYFAQLGLKF